MLSPEEQEGKSRLIREIEQNARNEAQEIIDKAEKTKSQKIAAAEGKAKRIIADAEERAAAKISQIDSRTDSSIQIQKKRIRLKQTEEIILHIFSKARKKIEEQVGSEKYIEVLKDWAAEGIIGLGADDVLLSVSEKERPCIDEAFIRKVAERVRALGGGGVAVALSEDTEPEYGVRVRSADGRLEYRNQIGTRIARKQDEYRKMIYSVLEIEGTS